MGLMGRAGGRGFRSRSAATLPADGVERVRRTVFAGWPVRRIHVERERPNGGVRPEFPGRRREMADFERGRAKARVAQRRPGTVFPQRRWLHDGREYERRTDVRGGRAEATFRGKRTIPAARTAVRDRCPRGSVLPQLAGIFAAELGYGSRKLAPEREVVSRGRPYTRAFRSSALIRSR